MSDNFIHENEQVLEPKFLLENDKSLQIVWDAAETDAFVQNTEIAWAKVAAKTGIIQSNKNQFYWFKSKAVLAAISAVAAVLLFFFALNSIFIHSEKTFTLSSDMAQNGIVVLPDQTRVHLKNNASITFTESFGKSERRVKLTGDAFFRVSKSKTKRFIVETESMNITVLGTSFMVFSDQNAKKVYVNSGKVAVSEGNEKVELKAGFLASKEKNNNRIEASKTQDTKFLEWRKQNLNFKNCKLVEAVLTIEDIYNLKLNIDVKVDLTQELTAEFKLREADEIVEAVALSFGLSFEKISENEYKMF